MNASLEEARSRATLVSTLFVIVGTLVASVASGQRSGVAKNWCEAVGNLVNTACVYPPRDVLVGDVIGYNKNPERRKWPRGLKFGLLGRFGEELEVPEPQDVVLPKVTGDVESDLEFDLLVPGVLDLGLKLSNTRDVGLTLGDVTLVEVTRSDVEGVLARIRKGDELAEELEDFDKSKRKVYLRFVTGVYAAKKLDVVITYSRQFETAVRARFDEARCGDGGGDGGETAEKEGSDAEAGSAGTTVGGNSGGAVQEEGPSGAGADGRRESGAAAEDSGSSAVAASTGAGKPKAAVCVSNVSGRTVELKVDREEPVAVAIKGWSFLYKRKGGTVEGRGPIGGFSPALIGN